MRIDPEVTAEEILKQLFAHAVPVFEKLSSRGAIVKYRRDFPQFDSLNHRLILLEEAMIYGRKGDLTTAHALFREYYRDALAQYEDIRENGSRHFLRKNEKVTYLNRKTNKTETIVAPSDGYVTLFNANRGHVDYLEDLARELDIPLL